MIYTYDAIRLFLTGKIRWRILLYALRERPIAVCGRGGSYQIDRTFTLGPD